MIGKNNSSHILLDINDRCAAIELGKSGNGGSLSRGEEARMNAEIQPKKWMNLERVLILVGRMK